MPRPVQHYEQYKKLAGYLMLPRKQSTTSVKQLEKFTAIQNTTCFQTALLAWVAVAI